MVTCYPCNGKGVLWTVDKWYFTGGFTTDERGETVPLVSGKESHTIICGCCGGLGFVYQAAPIYRSQNLRERSKQVAQETGIKREEGFPGRDNFNEGNSKRVGARCKTWAPERGNKMKDTAIITKQGEQKQGYICPVCGLDRAVARESGYLASLNHCNLFCRRRASTMQANVLPAALGEYAAKGFELVEIDDHLLDLKHEGEVIGHFTQHATIEALRSTCESHLATGGRF